MFIFDTNVYELMYLQYDGETTHMICDSGMLIGYSAPEEGQSSLLCGWWGTGTGCPEKL